MMRELPATSSEARREYAREILRRLLDEPVTHDAYWYRVQYLLASDYAHEQLDDWQDNRKAEADAAGKRAKQRSAELAVTIEKVLAERSWTKKDRYFHRFLEDIEPSALLLWAGVVTLLVGAAPIADTSERIPMDQGALRQQLQEGISHDTMPSARAVRIVETRFRLSARSRYNLACYYGVAAMLAAEAHDEKAEQQYSLKAIVQLDLASPGFSVAMSQWARRDPCLRQLASGRYQKDFEQALSRQAPIGGPAPSG